MMKRKNLKSNLKSLNLVGHNLKSFREQFVECASEGFHKKGKFISFEHHPEMLPLCPKKGKKILNSGCEGIDTIECGRFGGVCSSNHFQCCELRGYRII